MCFFFALVWRVESVYSVIWISGLRAQINSFHVFSVTEISSAPFHSICVSEPTWNRKLFFSVSASGSKWVKFGCCHHQTRDFLFNGRFVCRYVYVYRHACVCVFVYLDFDVKIVRLISIQWMVKAVCEINCNINFIKNFF